MSDEVKLLPCGKCGSECRVETFGPNKTITEPLQLFICSNNKQFGGNCKSERAYFGAPMWNQANTRAIEATRPPIGTDEVVAQSLGAIPGSHPADQAPSGLGASRFDPERVQTALERRVATYSMKQKLADPFAEDDSNKHERMAFAVECFEVFAQEAGLTIPPEIYAIDPPERTEP